MKGGRRCDEKACGCMYECEKTTSKLRGQASRPDLCVFLSRFFCTTAVMFHACLVCSLSSLVFSGMRRRPETEVKKKRVKRVKMQLGLDVFVVSPSCVLSFGRMSIAVRVIVLRSSVVFFLRWRPAGQAGCPKCRMSPNGCRVCCDRFEPT